MPLHTRDRCPPCDCLNKVEPLGVTVDSAGCTHCADPEYGSLCAYKILFGCTFWTTYGEVMAVPCVLVRRDCPDGCTYSSRWSETDGIDSPVIGLSGCTIDRTPIPTYTEEAIGGWLGGCTWISHGTTLGPKGCTDPEECFRKWVLEITTPTTAILTGTTRQGQVIIYETDEWQCYERSNFVMTQTSSVTSGIPRHLCVAPINAAYSSCDEACCDSGLASEEFDIEADVMSCDDVAIPAGTYSFARGGTMPAGVPQPSNECGYFWKEFSYTPSVACEQWPGLVGILIQCTSVSGTRARVCTIFCYDAIAEEWVDQGSMTITYSCCAPDNAIDVPNVTCCCEEEPPPCCDCTYTIELTWEIESTCPEIDGQTGTLNYGRFVSPVTGNAGCRADLSGGTGCSATNITLTCDNGDGLMFAAVFVSGGLFEGDVTITSCDPFMAEGTLFDQSNPTCCSAGVGDPIVFRLTAA
jgi:hypothetical protein